MYQFGDIHKFWPCVYCHKTTQCDLQTAFLRSFMLPDYLLLKTKLKKQIMWMLPINRWMLYYALKTSIFFIRKPNNLFNDTNYPVTKHLPMKNKTFTHPFDKKKIFCPLLLAPNTCKATHLFPSPFQSCFP